MRPDELVGKAQTVLGTIDADRLGVTLPHEHLIMDLSATSFVEPTDAKDKRLAHQPVGFENLHWVKMHRLSNLDDLRLTDEQLAIREAMFYKRAGGNTIVELSTAGHGRDPVKLTQISRATGLNIVAGAGYFIGATHPPELATKTEEEIAEEIVKEVLVGIGDTAVHAGIMGEIGCSLPLEDRERKVLRAIATAQQLTGAAISLHPSPSDDLALEIISILDDAGADLSRTVIGHADAFCFSRTSLGKIADAGCYVAYDSFGLEGAFPPYQGRYLDMPSDMQRINDIIQLIADGYLNQILLSTDMCFKHRLISYGGHGYDYILRTIVPVMRGKGITDEQIQTLLVENPKRLLTFAQLRKR